VILVVALVFGCALGVDVVDCWARDVAWKTTERIIVDTATFAAGFELLATQAAGQQVR